MDSNKAILYICAALFAVMAAYTANARKEREERLCEAVGQMLKKPVTYSYLLGCEVLKNEGPESK